MPEGDALFRTARTLHRALAGKTVTRFESAYAHVAAAAVDAPVVGRTIDGVRAVGKHLLIELSGGLVLRTHMRMNGSWHIYRPGERWQLSPRLRRLLLATDDFVAVGFSIPVAELETAAELHRDPALRRLGPDLLSPAFDEDEALRRLRARPERAIGEALIDQSVMAGAGNIFKSETLFLTGIDPFTPVGRLAEARLRALIDTARRLLAANVTPDAGIGIVTTGNRGRGRRLWVYHRAGEPCRKCRSAIVFTRQGLDARPTYHCPRCQPRVD
jgi:endonuclease-8